MKSDNFKNNKGLIETKCLKINISNFYGNLMDKFRFIKSVNNAKTKEKNKVKKSEKIAKENLYKNEDEDEDEDFYEDEYDIYDKDYYY